MLPEGFPFHEFNASQNLNNSEKHKKIMTKLLRRNKRKWTQESRKRKQKTTNKVVNETKETQSNTHGKVATVPLDITATTRKRTERIRKIMPQK